MRRCAVIGALLVALGAAAGCAGESGDALPTKACAKVFERRAELSNLRDQVTDLDEGLDDCRSLADWKAASKAHEGALDGVDPVTFLENRCLDEVNAGRRLCEQT